jgi:hypothetical protein
MRRVLITMGVILQAAILPEKASSDDSPNLVRVEGHSLHDNSGPFLGLGASYFQALRRAKFDRARLTNDLAFLASKKFNYVRVLSMVGWYGAWEGREIAPVSFRNRSGKSVAAWPDYWQQFREMIDITYGHGLRAQVTIFADAQLMPDKADRINHIRTMLEQLAGREHKIILLEVANEAWQNGFPGAQGVADLREFTKFLAERTSIPVAITSNHEADEAALVALHKDSGAGIATFHFSRDRRTVEGGWLPVRDCYWAGSLPGLPPFSSNEPIGPGSSVAAENDPIKLVMAAAFGWTANLPMYVFHSSAGVFGREKFEDMPGAGDFVHLQKILPPDLPNWQRNDGREPGAPFTVFANGQRDKWWPEVTNPTNGVVRNTGATKGGEFVALPIGILDGGVALQARRPMEFRVFNPLTGAVVTNVTLNAGGEVRLPRGPGAYILCGSYREEIGQTCSAETESCDDSPGVLSSHRACVAMDSECSSRVVRGFLRQLHSAVEADREIGRLRVGVKDLPVWFVRVASNSRHAPNGGCWRFSNPARCMHCTGPIAGSILNQINYVVYPDSIITDQAEQLTSASQLTAGH